MPMIIKTDVLVIGTGPCGLMAGILLSQYGIKFRIIHDTELRDQEAKIVSLQPRTLEVLESLDLRERIERKGQRVFEYAVYARDAQSHLQRTRREPDGDETMPYPYSVTIAHGDLISILEHELEERGHTVERSIGVLTCGKATVKFPRLHVLDSIDGQTAEATASFVLLCSGYDELYQYAGIPVDRYGDTWWAEANVSLTTDFEDIRRRCTIQSVHGSCLLTPCPYGVRVQTVLSELDLQSGRWEDRAEADGTKSPPFPALRDRVAAAIWPHSLDIGFDNTSYFSKYLVTKYLVQNFSNARLNVLLLGTAACGTSPLTRQGINGGIMDAWNLIWKLGLVLKGQIRHSLLSTYDTERRGLLLKAMDFDVNADAVFASTEKRGQDFIGLHDFKEASGYISGCGVRYPASDLIREERRLWVRKAVQVITAGKRLLPTTLTRHVDGSRFNLLNVLGANCHFKVILSVGTFNSAIIHGLAGFLMSSSRSPLPLMGINNLTSEPLLDMIIIHTMPHLTVSIRDLPQPFPRFAENIFEDVEGKWHHQLGIRAEYGGLYLVRPDGYVAYVSNPDDCGGIKEYMENLRP